MEMRNLPDEVFKVLVIKMLTELGRRMDEHNENFNKETENIRKYQTEIIIELKNTLQGFNIRIDEVEEQISELEDKTMKLTQTEQQNEKRILLK